VYAENEKNLFLLAAVFYYKAQDTQNYNFACCFYECEAWSLTLREERRLRVCENGVLRKIFGRKRDEATVDCRRQHNGEPDDLYSSPMSFG